MSSGSGSPRSSGASPASRRTCSATLPPGKSKHGYRNGPPVASKLAAILEIGLDEEQLEVLVRMQIAGGWVSLEAMALSALEKMQDHLDITGPRDVLAPTRTMGRMGRAR